MSEPVYNYMIAYDAFASIKFSDKLLAFIKENGKVMAWSKPFEGIYLIKSSYSLHDITFSVREFFGNSTSHFVQSVSPNFILGIAPPEIWTWLQMNSQSQLLEWGGKR